MMWMNLVVCLHSLNSFTIQLLQLTRKVHCKVVLASSCKYLASSVNTVYKKFYILFDDHEKNQSHWVGNLRFYPQYIMTVQTEITVF